jgi:hypothetical protein
MPVELTLQAAAPGSMTISEARALVRQFAREAGGPGAFENDQIDRAIIAGCNLLVQGTQCLVGVSAITFDSGSYATSVEAADVSAGFVPELLRAAYVGDEELSVTSDFRIRELRRTRGLRTGTPEYMAFTGHAAAICWPAPVAETVVNIRYLVPFPSYTAGTATDSAVIGALASPVIPGLPAQHLRELCTNLIPAILQHTDPQQLYTSAAYQKGLAYIESQKGSGGMGARSA